ncbi:MAG: type II toxin-antitoxin system Phd/YefM family antitoxin [Treponema sp.]|nr:type II toxin-antitoxin system Phd/YefM family antitoxin [Treponema sp.]
MKFISVKDFRTAPADIWKKLSAEREMVVTNNGKPLALVIPVKEDMLEDTVSAIRRIKALNALKKMQEISASLGNDKMTLEKINTVIKDIRGKNKK